MWVAVHRDGQAECCMNTEQLCIIKCKNVKVRWFKGYETEVRKALAGGSEVNYMKKHNQGICGQGK